MAVGRTSTITGTLVNPDQSLATSVTVTAQLLSALTGTPLLTYFVAADPANGEIIQPQAVTALSDPITAVWSMALTAPADIVQSDATGNHASSTYYQFSSASGLYVTSTAFAYSGSPRDISAITAASTATPYTTAPVTFQIVIPNQTGAATVVQAWLNTPGSIGGVLVPNSPPFQTVLGGSGTGTLNLPPNDQISPAGTYYNVSFNSGPTYQILVPTAGGAFLNLLTAPLPAGSLAANGAIPAGGLAYYTTKWGRQTLGALRMFV